MTPFSLQITYRKGRPFAAYIYLARRPGQPSARTEEVGPDLLIDHAADGTPIGIEIVSPEEVAMDEILGVFDRLGLRRLAPDGSGAAAGRLSGDPPGFTLSLRTAPS